MEKTIAEVKITKTGEKDGKRWTAYSVLFTDSQKASTFDHKIATMGGKTVDVELEQNGQYTDIKSWKPVTEFEPPKENPPLTPAQPVQQPNREASIEAQVAIKEIGEDYRADQYVPPGYMDLYWGWISKALAGILPKPKPATTSKAKASVKEIEPDSIPD